MRSEIKSALEHGYFVSIELECGLMKLHFSEALTPGRILLLRSEMQRAYKRLEELGTPRGQHRVFAYSREHGIQTKAVTENLGALAAEMSGAAYRVAVLVSNTLHKLQVQRVAADSNVRSFLTEEEAMAWLFF